MKLCECGCGQHTSLVTRTITARGLRIGEYRRFAASGHSSRVKPKTTYPVQGTGAELKRIHRMRAERALGHPLPPRAVVHHADGSTRADAPLVICENQAYHALLHQRMRVLKAGGNPNTDAVCGYCGKAKLLVLFPLNPRNHATRRSYLCQTCTTIKSKARPSRSARAPIFLQ